MNYYNYDFVIYKYGKEKADALAEYLCNNSDLSVSEIFKNHFEEIKYNNWYYTKKLKQDVEVIDSKLENNGYCKVKISKDAKSFYAYVMYDENLFRNVYTIMNNMSDFELKESIKRYVNEDIESFLMLKNIRDYSNVMQSIYDKVSKSKNYEITINYENIDRHLMFNFCNEVSNLGLESITFDWNKKTMTIHKSFIREFIDSKVDKNKSKDDKGR